MNNLKKFVTDLYSLFADYCVSFSVVKESADCIEIEVGDFLVFRPDRTLNSLYSELAQLVNRTNDNSTSYDDSSIVYIADVAPDFYVSIER